MSFLFLFCWGWGVLGFRMFLVIGQLKWLIAKKKEKKTTLKPFSLGSHQPFSLV
jgi:hypothetical protein